MVRAPRRRRGAVSALEELNLAFPRVDNAKRKELEKGRVLMATEAKGAKSGRRPAGATMTI